MIRLRVALYGENKTTEHPTWPAAHHALVKSAASHGISVRFDLDVVKGTISGEFVSGDPRNTRGSTVWGSFLMGESE